jgi:putative Mg2+ transporter-C (MgtC) family protein
VFHSNDNVEVAAVLVPLAAAPDDLDAVVADLSKLPGVSHATWQVNALE